MVVADGSENAKNGVQIKGVMQAVMPETRRFGTMTCTACTWPDAGLKPIEPVGNLADRTIDSHGLKNQRGLSLAVRDK